MTGFWKDPNFGRVDRNFRVLPGDMKTEVRDWEPPVELFAGDGGLEIYEWLLAGARRVVKPGGRLMMELGYRSLEPVRSMLADYWTDIVVVNDLAGWPRMVQARLIDR